MVNQVVSTEKEKAVVVVSAAKAYVKTCDERTQTLRLSSDALERLNIIVRGLLKKAAKTALDNGQKTVLVRDLPHPEINI